jgi:methionyl aminopeptidase
VDVTVYHRGFHGDLNETLFIGEVDERSKKLTQVTHEAIMAAIAIVKPGMRFREIGNVIQNHVTPHGYSVVRSYCGHGIHRLFHTAPNIPHYSSEFCLFIYKKNCLINRKFLIIEIKNEKITRLWELPKLATPSPSSR